MSKIKNPAAMLKAYEATKKKLNTTGIPTMPIYQDQTIFRSFDPAGQYSPLPKPTPGGVVSPMLANSRLVPSDGIREGNNRFSGPGGAGIPPAGGLYCVLQQQALVNEAVHYNRRVAQWALAGKCVLKVRVTQRIQVAELSPHSSGSRRFLRELGAGTWEEMNDPNDYSVARGIGLAIAECQYLNGLVYQTVRTSDRSDEERGDNLVLFAPQGSRFAFLTVEEAIYFGRTRTPEVFTVG